MQDRQNALNEIYTRLKDDVFVQQSLKELSFVPEKSLGKAQMPAILILPGRDSVSKRNARDRLGYPFNRTLEVWIECWDLSNGNVLNIYNEARKSILAAQGILIDNEAWIRENDTIGPYNAGIPGIEGFRGQFLLEYFDQGPFV